MRRSTLTTSTYLHPSWLREPDFSDYDYSQDDEYDGFDAVPEDDAPVLTEQELLNQRLDEWKYF